MSKSNKRTAKAAPQPKADVVPAGAAKGATDNQPHTKRAIAEQRAKEKAEFEATKDAQVAAGKVYLLDPRRNVTGWFDAKGKWPVGAVKLYPVAGKGAAKRAAAKAAKASTRKAPRKAAAPRASANRAYTKGVTKNEAKPGTWRHHMLTMIQGNKDTDSAKAAHAKSGQFAGNALDFNWSAKQGYIVFK